jgi:hypothetical protein
LGINPEIVQQEHRWISMIGSPINCDYPTDSPKKLNSGVGFSCFMPGPASQFIGGPQPPRPVKPRS